MTNEEVRESIRRMEEFLKERGLPPMKQGSKTGTVILVRPAEKKEDK